MEINIKWKVKKKTPQQQQILMYVLSNVTAHNVFMKEIELREKKSMENNKRNGICRAHGSITISCLRF